MNSTTLISIEKKHKWPSATASNELLWSQLSSLISSLSLSQLRRRKKLFGNAWRHCKALPQLSFFARAHSKVNFLLFPLLHRSLIPFNELNFFCEYFVCGWKTEAICFSRERGNQVKLVFFSFTFNVTMTAGFFVAEMMSVYLNWKIGLVNFFSNYFVFYSWLIFSIRFDGDKQVFFNDDKQFVGLTIKWWVWFLRCLKNILK